MTASALAPGVAYLGAAPGPGMQIPLSAADVLALRQEDSRRWLAAALVALLGLLVLVPLIFYAFGGANVVAIQDLLELAFTPVLGLIATVVGFYFGQKSEK